MLDFDNWYPKITEAYIKWEFISVLDRKYEVSLSVIGKKKKKKNLSVSRAPVLFSCFCSVGMGHT